ncbi:endonuclease/exonuclease/phosphatase family protein, partial [candidate division CSSED10-310 bacterium]
IMITSIFFMMIGPPLEWCNRKLDNVMSKIVAYNVKTVGNEYTPVEFDALLMVINRINGDIVCIEEMKGDDDITALEELSTQLLTEYDLDYPWSCYSDVSGSFNPFNLRTACLSKYRIVDHHSWSSAELSGDPNADDLTRDLMCVVINWNNFKLGVIVVHLKSGSTSTDRFRRAIEIIRIKQVVERFHQDYPDQPFVILGDFNEEVVEGPFGNVYDSLPSSLPGAYELGNDISLPVTYDPFVHLQEIDMDYVQASHEDTFDDYNSYVNIDYRTYKRLDYIFYNNTRLGRYKDMVYDACDK